MVIGGRYYLFGLAATVLAACTTQVGTLEVTLTKSYEADEEPLQGVAKFVRVRVDGPDLRVGPLTVGLGARQAVLEEVPVGEDRRVTVEGLGPVENVVSRGRSGPLTVRSGANTLELYLGLTDTQGRFSFTPRRLHGPRAYHTATLLQDGSVLLAGGTDVAWRPESATAPSSALRTAERLGASSIVVEPSRGNCLQPGQPGCLTAPRIGHTASLLASGVVLLAGGWNGLAPTATLELYDPGSRELLRGGDMKVIQSWHQAAPHARGVALIGGVDAVGNPVDHGQVYEQGTLGAFYNLQVARRAFTVTALPDGSLLVVGGFGGTGEPLRSLELLKPHGIGWSRQSFELKQARAHHTATLLADGSVLIVGGLSDGGQATTEVERVFPQRAEVLALDRISQARWGHTATLLADGRVLVAGGFGGSRAGAPVPSVEAITLLGDSQSHVRPLANMRESRAGHSATRLTTDLVLVTGGFDGSKALDTCEVFVY